MPTKKIKTRTCKGCGKIDVGISRNLVTAYCSRECFIAKGAGKHLRTGRIYNCLWCGDEFYRRGSWVNPMFCSAACRDNYKRQPEAACPTCGKIFIPRPKNKRFCSRKCSKTGSVNPQWKGGISKRVRTKAVKSWRLEVLERDGFRCRVCGTARVRLHAHHIKSFSKFPKLRLVLENGLTLCHPCHTKTSDYGVKAWQAFQKANAT